MNFWLTTEKSSYQLGDTVTGTVYLHVKEERKSVSALVLRLLGKEVYSHRQCQQSPPQLQKQRSHHEHHHHHLKLFKKHHHSDHIDTSEEKPKEHLFQQEKTVLDYTFPLLEDISQCRMTCGDYEFPFEFILPSNNLPASCKVSSIHTNETYSVNYHIICHFIEGNNHRDSIRSLESNIDAIFGKKEIFLLPSSLPLRVLSFSSWYDCITPLELTIPSFFGFSHNECLRFGIQVPKYIVLDKSFDISYCIQNHSKISHFQMEFSLIAKLTPLATAITKNDASKETATATATEGVDHELKLYEKILPSSMLKMKPSMISPTVTTQKHHHSTTKEALPVTSSELFQEMKEVLSSKRCLMRGFLSEKLIFPDPSIISYGNDGLYLISYCLVFKLVIPATSSMKKRSMELTFPVHLLRNNSGNTERKSTFSISEDRSVRCSDKSEPSVKGGGATLSEKQQDFSDVIRPHLPRSISEMSIDSTGGGGGATAVPLNLPSRWTPIIHSVCQFPIEPTYLEPVIRSRTYENVENLSSVVDVTELLSKGISSPSPFSSAASSASASAASGAAAASAVTSNVSFLGFENLLLAMQSSYNQYDMFVKWYESHDTNVLAIEEWTSSHFYSFYSNIRTSYDQICITERLLQLRKTSFTIHDLMAAVKGCQKEIKVCIAIKLAMNCYPSSMEILLLANEFSITSYEVLCIVTSFPNRWSLRLSTYFKKPLQQQQPSCDDDIHDLTVTAKREDSVEKLRIASSSCSSASSASSSSSASSVTITTVDSCSIESRSEETFSKNLRYSDDTMKSVETTVLTVDGGGGGGRSNSDSISITMDDDETHTLFFKLDRGMSIPCSDGESANREVIMKCFQEHYNSMKVG
jgi:hypothetical protein